MNSPTKNPAEPETATSPPAASTADVVLVPRWVVYFQAAMLGLVAATFFIFGLMVGFFCNPSATEAPQGDGRVSGSVMFRQAGREFPDAGSVVFLLPDPPREIERQDPESVRPHNFEPLENPAIDWITGVGGSVVRINAEGRFEVFAAPGNYSLLIISKAKQQSDETVMSKEQVAAISQYFLPVEKLVQKQAWFWKNFEVIGDEEVAIEPVLFE